MEQELTAARRISFKLDMSVCLMTLLLAVVALMVLTPLFLMILNSFQVAEPGQPMIYGLRGWREAFTSKGMLSKPLDLVINAVTTDCFKSLDDLCMQHPPPFLEQAAIGHFMGQGMLEGILALGKQLCFIDELCCL